MWPLASSQCPRPSNRPFVMKLDLTTRFPSFFPTFWYQFRLLLCYHMTWIHNNHVITLPLSLWCHYQHTHHVTCALLPFPPHDALYNSPIQTLLLFPTPCHTLCFSTQTISFYSHSTTSPYDQLLLVILYSHPTPSLYDQLLLVTLHSHSTMLSLLLQYTSLSHHSHSTTHSLLLNT